MHWVESLTFASCSIGLGEARAVDAQKRAMMTAAENRIFKVAGWAEEYVKFWANMGTWTRDEPFKEALGNLKSFGVSGGGWHLYPKNPMDLQQSHLFEYCVLADRIVANKPGDEDVP